ncbi:MAG: hypothetical protein U0556_17220 [Dehalococcoidia bacterium]
MNDDLNSIEIDAMPDLVRLVEQAERSGVPVRLCRDGRVVASVVPHHRRTVPQTRPRSDEDREAFLGAAGAWRDLDTEAMIDAIYRAREDLGFKPPLGL